MNVMNESEIGIADSHSCSAHLGPRPFVSAGLRLGAMGIGELGFLNTGVCLKLSASSSIGVAISCNKLT